MVTTLDRLKEAVLHFLDWNYERIERCLATLTEAQVWERPNGNSNSVGNQLLHLEGNLRQWALHGLGHWPDVRHRDAEFAATDGPDKAGLLAGLHAVVREMRTVVAELDEPAVLAERPVQAYVHDGVFILLHVTEHLSYHTGQIVFWTKLVRDVDLDFYGGVDLNARGATEE